MTETHDVSTRKVAGLAFVLAGVAVVASFGFSLIDVAYDSPTFMYFHAAAFLAAILTAIGVTALVYAVGPRRLGLAGIVGSAFAWLAVGASLFWLMIAWQAATATKDAPSSLEYIVPVLSPMGTGMFAVTGVLVMVGLATTAIGLFGAGIVHPVLAGVGVLPGVVGAALFIGLTLGDTAILELLIPVAVIAWLWTLPLGIALFRGLRLIALEAETDAPLSS